MITIFETWKDNSIDKTLFTSNRAKHNPKVINNIIEYKTDNGEYIATIKQVGRKFLCKIYSTKGDGSKIRIRKKLKDNLDTAHNFTREYLNDRLEGKNLKKKKKKSKKSKLKKDDNPLDKLFVDDIDDNFDSEFTPEFNFRKPKKTTIRRFT